MRANLMTVPIIVAMLAGTAHGAIVTTGDGLGADAYVRNGSSAAQNFGGDTELLAKTTTGSGYHRVIYLRFDLSAYAGLTITDATLSLTQLVGSGTSPAGTNWIFGVYGLSESAEDWIEGAGTGASPGATGIRFTGQPVPAFSSTSGVIPVSASNPLLGTFSITGMSAPGIVSQMSSQALVDFIAADADGIVSLAIYRHTSESAGGGTAYHAFASAENGMYASPSLSFTAIPSHGGPAVMALAGVLAIGRRKSR